jgi:hypothetical protein
MLIVLLLAAVGVEELITEAEVELVDFFTEFPFLYHPHPIR